MSNDSSATSAPAEREAFEKLLWGYMMEISEYAIHHGNTQAMYRAKKAVIEAYEARARYAAPVAGTEELRTAIERLIAFAAFDKDEGWQRVEDVRRALGVLPPTTLTDADAEGNHG